MGSPGIPSKKSAATASKSPVPARGNNNRLPSHDLDHVMPQVPKRPTPQTKTRTTPMPPPPKPVVPKGMISLRYKCGVSRGLSGGLPSGL
jgi:hypothetical protein